VINLAENLLFGEIPQNLGASGNLRKSVSLIHLVFSPSKTILEDLFSMHYYAAIWRFSISTFSLLLSLFCFIIEKLTSILTHE